jgi:hypothetical protein
VVADDKLDLVQLVPGLQMFQGASRAEDNTLTAFDSSNTTYRMYLAPVKSWTQGKHYTCVDNRYRVFWSNRRPRSHHLQASKLHCIFLSPTPGPHGIALQFSIVTTSPTSEQQREQQWKIINGIEVEAEQPVACNTRFRFNMDVIESELSSRNVDYKSSRASHRAVLFRLVCQILSDPPTIQTAHSQVESASVFVTWPPDPTCGFQFVVWIALSVSLSLSLARSRIFGVGLCALY